MKKSFILYQDQRENFELLPDKECKELLMAIFDYPDVKELSPLAKLSFVSIKNQLKRDLDKWNNIMERNRINGKLGGRPITQSKPKKPSGLSGNPKNPVTVNDNVTVTVNVTNNSIEYLLNIPDKDIDKIYTDLGVEKEDIYLKGKELYDWCGSKGKKYKDYYLFLRTCLRGDLKRNPVKKSILKELRHDQIEDIKNNPQKLKIYRDGGYNVSKIL